MAHSPESAALDHAKRQQPAPSPDGVARAAGLLLGRIVRTPLLRNASLDAACGRPVLLKPECLQRTGSFKIRGASHFLASLEPERRQKGVVAFSSGNHAQGVAAAAADWDVPATIVMPDDAPAVKRRATQRLGAKIVPYDRAGEDREAIARSIATETGATLVPPYDHGWIIEGQGTAGLELLDDAAALGIEPGLIVTPAGGGGLLAGLCLAAEHVRSSAAFIAAEPEGFDDHRLSFDKGRRCRADGGESICDALLAPVPGELTFSISKARGARGVAVSDDEVMTAMAAAFEWLKVVLEPGGAVALAAMLSGKVPEGDGPVAVVLSGGNADPPLYARAVKEGAVRLESAYG